jgi:hypothetical protein
MGGLIPEPPVGPPGNMASTCGTDRSWPDYAAW